MNIEELTEYTKTKMKYYTEEFRKAFNKNDKNEAFQYFKGLSDAYQDIFLKITGKDVDSLIHEVEWKRTRKIS